MSALVCNGEIVQGFMTENNLYVQFRATVVDPRELRRSYGTSRPRAPPMFVYFGGCTHGRPRALPMLVYFGGYTDEDPMEQTAREVSECAQKFANVAEESLSWFNRCDHTNIGGYWK